MDSMKPKRHWHHIWTILRPIRSWYLAILLFVSVSMSVFGLRSNNLAALSLRDNVLKVDQQNGDVETALRQLRIYVYAHMNTDLTSGPNAIKPPIQLKYRYDRLVAIEKDRVSSVNAKVYNDAQTTCEQLFPHGLSGGGRVPCIQDYVTAHGAKEKTIVGALYKFDFASPVWSSDLAGWSLASSAFVGLLLGTRLVAEYWLKSYLHERNN